MKDLFEEIFMAMRMNKMRTALTGFAIAWGIFMLVVLLACSNGVKNAMQLNFSSMSQNTVRVYGGWRSLPYKGMKKNTWVGLRYGDVEFLRAALPEAEVVTPNDGLWGASVGMGSTQYQVTLYAVKPDFSTLSSIEILSGRFINELDMRDRRKVTVLHRQTAAKIFPAGTDPVGKFVNVTYDSITIPFQVVGLYDMAGMDRYQTAYVPFSTEQTIYRPSGEINAIDILINNIKDEEGAEAFAEKVRGLLSRRLIFDPADQGAIWIHNRIDQYMQTQNVMGGITTFVWIIGFGMLIAGVVGVSNIMLITVKERTREIGIRKAIGATPGSILGLVLMESLCITAMFGYIGMLLGIGVSELLCRIFPEAAYDPSSPSMFVNPSVDIGTVVAATLVLVVAGLLAGYFPARKAVMIKPIEAMNAK